MKESMQTRIAIPILMIWISCIACCSKSQTGNQKVKQLSNSSASESETIGGEDANVLHSVLDAICRGDGKSFFIISDRSLSSKDFESKIEIGSLEFSNMISRNKTTFRLPTVPICPNIQIVTETEIEAVFLRKTSTVSQPSSRHPGWEGFYSTYPKASGLLRLSLPGYSTNRRHAVVVISTQAELMIGFGFLYTLEKTTSVWRVASVKTLWQS
jgi:hypothetical protein